MKTNDEGKQRKGRRSDRFFRECDRPRSETSELQSPRPEVCPSTVTHLRTHPPWRLSPPERRRGVVTPSTVETMNSDRAGTLESDLLDP